MPQCERPAGRNAPTTAPASGRKITMLRWIVIRASARRDQEVEAKAGEAGDKEGGVRAQVARLQPPCERRPGAHDRDRAAHDHVLYEDALDHRAPELPERRGGADEHGVVELVEVPLVREEVVHLV